MRRAFTMLLAGAAVLVASTATAAAATEDVTTPNATTAAKKGGPWSDPPPAAFYSRQPNSAPECAPGYTCMKIKAGSQSWYYDFWYFDYGYYSLENWVGHGYLNNRQTGGATLRTYDAAGRLIECYASDPNAAVSNPDWTPVYTIQLSAARC
ncbi:hypothetical protein [Amycolatopsis pigmentata]|uniref:Peptidase inhibitor family I36 n=1 Tax=Amycolatopsis pigmentata TaxID=450801 RepID=A0ABW5FXW3_9PSEU